MEVKVIKANSNLQNRKKVANETRLRVAAYCRVSTDSEEQLLSYESQVQYYEKLINEREDWVLYEIFADEAITGTKVDKREEFQKMIKAGVDGEIDMVITKSISRFARNTIDTLNYVRLLKEHRVAVFFEEENINTLTMDGELLLTILSSVAQQEVHNTSEHVKKGLKMKMERGELIGFQGCLGYDYHPEDKSITINEEEAVIVKYIFKRYIEGLGTYVIAKELQELGYKTKRGSSKWSDTTIMGILKNEKYKGDILLGKTFTVDPISKRRLKNFGESDRFYMENHHEPIIPAEVFDAAMEITKERRPSALGINQFTNAKREKITKMYAFSSMLECGFCKANLTRRKKNVDRNVWQCTNSTRNGKKSCNHALSLDEALLEKAFVEALNHLVDPKNTEKINDFLETVEMTLLNDAPTRKIKDLEIAIEELERKKNDILDLKLSGVISKEDCEKKYVAIADELKIKSTELSTLKEVKSSQLETKKRLDGFREQILSKEKIDIFSRDVLETTVDKIIVGGYRDDGAKDPFLINFVFKSKPSNKDYIGSIDRTKILKLGEFDCAYNHFMFATNEEGYKQKVLLHNVHVIFSLNTEERTVEEVKIG